MKNNRYKIIDLFSGAGGLTEGFRGKNWEVISHVEKEAAASKTLQLRDAYYYLKNNNKLYLYAQFLNQEISEEELFSNVPKKIQNKTLNEAIGEDTIDSIFEKISLDLNKNKVSGVIGGPPCQAYSTIGRSVNSRIKETDGRIYLYRYYIEFLKKYKPEFFVFENVKGLLSFKDSDNELLFPKMQEEFRESGYELDFRLVNTAEYGIPQKRERIIIFGVPKKNKALISEFFNQLHQLKEPPVDLKTALEDLPKLKAGQVIDVYSKQPNSYIQKHFRTNHRIPLTQNVSRPNKENDLNIYKIVSKAKKNGQNVKYNELPNKLRTHSHQDKFLDRYKALDWNGQSHTVVAHIAKDGHHYIHPDINQNRSITVREAARIQGFPDDYYFENSRTAAFTQIGNAVPPILSQKISRAIEKLNI